MSGNVCNSGMYVIDYITPDRCGHIILAATEADAAKGMGKAFAEMLVPPEIVIKAGHIVSQYLKSKSFGVMVVKGITPSPISQESFESWTRALFPSPQQ